MIPNTSYDIIWPYQASNDNPASFPMYESHLFCLGVVPPGQPLLDYPLLAEEPVQYNGKYITTQDSMLVTSHQWRERPSLPNNGDAYDLAKHRLVTNLYSLPNGFYPVTAWIDEDYDGHFNLGRESAIENWINQTENAPSITIDETVIPCGWVLKIGDLVLTQNYTDTWGALGEVGVPQFVQEEFQEYGGATNMVEAREYVYQKMKVFLSSVTALPDKYNRVYLGGQEITSRSIYFGNNKIETLHKVINPFRELGHYETGDAVLWDNTGQLFKVCPPENITLLDTERYTPTGVIAIPSSHDVYGTGEAGVVALMSASLTTPDVGATRCENIRWGASGADYDALKLYYQLCAVGIESGAQKDNAVVNNVVRYILDSSSNLPSDEVVADPIYTKAIDGTYYAKNSSSEWNNCLPSPYLADGSRNFVYSQTSSSSTPEVANGLSDFSGKENTDFLCSKAISQTDWKTATTITNSSDAGYNPAACTCWRYHTAGTSQGDWYLPAGGELGYIYVRVKKLGDVMSRLTEHFNTPICTFSSNYPNCSSTRCASNSAVAIEFFKGNVDGWSCSSALFVRPFTRLK